MACVRFKVCVRALGSGTGFGLGLGLCFLSVTYIDKF